MQHLLTRSVSRSSVAILAMLSLCAAAVTPALSAEPQPGWADADPPAFGPLVGAQGLTVDGDTRIDWRPEPFDFIAGDRVRYIDHASGDDANPGTQARPWKHHPWDDNATGRAAYFDGPATYVFKRGVAYRGTLAGHGSGKPDEAIRLTSDPEWGQGEAILAGSDRITAEWQRVTPDLARRAGLPDVAVGKAWYAKQSLDQRPWAAWRVDDGGDWHRLTTARWPNWKKEHPYNHFTQWLRVERVEQGFPFAKIYAPKALEDPDPQAYDGATVWMDHPNTSGEFSILGPFPSAARNYNPQTGKLDIGLNHPARHPAENSPFFLENLPRFLDEPGEWHYSHDGPDAGTVYLWLPDEADPNDARIELAQRTATLDLRDQAHVRVAGLTFAGGNSIDLNDAPGQGRWTRPAGYARMAAVRVIDDARDIHLHHLTVRDTAGAGVVNWITRPGTTQDGVTVADSRFERIDAGAVKFVSDSAELDAPQSRLHNIRILRNRLDHIGFRAASNQGGRAIDLTGLLTGEIAGNVVDTVAAQGVNVVGGYFGDDLPLIRILIHHNLVRDALMYKTDFGNIEFWGVGPAYVFNNIAINPVGFVAHRNVYHKNEAFYFDHGAKGYLFNNIGWSDSRDDAYKGILGDHFFKEIRNRWNQAFHNTAYNFRKGQSHASRHGSQQHYLANIFMNCHFASHSHWTLDEVPGLGFAHNVIAGDYEDVYSRWRGTSYKTAESFRERLESLPNMIATQVGWETSDTPVRDPEARDFRPTGDSAAIDRGVKVFVPWSLAATVGEWHFRHEPGRPDRALAYDAYLQPFHLHHSHTRRDQGVPTNDLAGQGIQASSYIAGASEDWTESAVRFNGATAFRLPHDRLVQPFETTRSRGKNTWSKSVRGPDRKTVRMTDNDFVIEAIVRPARDADGGTLAGKIDERAGYVLGFDPQGRPRLTLQHGGVPSTWTVRQAPPADRWHHLLAEVDRANGRVTLYVNGKTTDTNVRGAMPSPDASLDNDADFTVGEGFVGDLDFLRVARATLADSRTSIDELMAWQFRGPHLHDITGQAPTGGIRDAGAIEHPTVAGRQPIRFTPPEDAVATNSQDGDGEGFKTGDDRAVKTLDWGAVSVPATASVGDTLDIQVQFGTETLNKPHILRVDQHAFVDDQRKPGYGRALPVQVAPNSTAVHTIALPVKPRKGLDRVASVIYASPDGSFKNRTVSTEVYTNIVASGTTDSDASKTNGDEPRPDDQGDASDQDVVVKPTDWGRLTITKNPGVGDIAEVTVTLDDGVVTEATTLRVDMHWWKGRNRAGGAGSFGRRDVQPGDTGPFVLRRKVPDRDGITAIAGVVYLSPDGSWRNKTHNGEVGTSVK